MVRQDGQSDWPAKGADPSDRYRGAIRAAGTVVPVWIESWFPGVWGGGSIIFLWDPPSGRRGLEGKNQSFKVSRGLEEEARKKKTKQKA